jgi:hypothetical protein
MPAFSARGDSILAGCCALDTHTYAGFMQSRSASSRIHMRLGADSAVVQ